jgi:hypothetical protein
MTERRLCDRCGEPKWCSCVADARAEMRTTLGETIADVIAGAAKAGVSKGEIVETFFGSGIGLLLSAHPTLCAEEVGGIAARMAAEILARLEKEE